MFDSGNSRHRKMQLQGEVQVLLELVLQVVVPVT